MGSKDRIGVHGTDEETKRAKEWLGQRRGAAGVDPTPVGRKMFKEKAKALKLVIEGQEKLAEAKTFATNSYGWQFNDKMDVMIDGVKVRVQIGCNIIIIGSKEMPEGS